jgi:hypothetical protein
MKTKLLLALGLLLTALASGHAQTTFTKITTGASSRAKRLHSCGLSE